MTILSTSHKKNLIANHLNDTVTEKSDYALTHSDMFEVSRNSSVGYLGNKTYVLEDYFQLLG